MGKKIFVIDDEQSMTQLVSALLGLKGYKILSDNDPRRGLERLATEECDALIVDLMMPGLDGLSLVGKLRGTERLAKLPIIVLSAKTLTDAERKALLGYGVRFTQKPIAPSRLLEVVRESLAAVA